MANWRNLVDALTEKIAQDQRIRWVIDDLRAGSATATIRAITDNGTAAPVVDAYHEVGEALSQGRPQMLTIPTVRDEAIALTGLINGEVEYIRFETAERDLVIRRRF